LDPDPDPGQPKNGIHTDPEPQYCNKLPIQGKPRIKSEVAFILKFSQIQYTLGSRSGSGINHSGSRTQTKIMTATIEPVRDLFPLPILGMPAYTPDNI
jgi:hypothetical protein